MSKNQNYYIAVTAEGKFYDNDNDIIINGFVKLSPGCDKAWLLNELSDVITNSNQQKPDEIVITSLSQISRGLYNRLTNQEN